MEPSSAYLQSIEPTLDAHAHAHTHTHTNKQTNKQTNKHRSALHGSAFTSGTQRAWTLTARVKPTSHSKFSWVHSQFWRESHLAQSVGSGGLLKMLANDRLRLFCRFARPGLLAYRALELLAIEAFRSLLASSICRLHTEAGPRGRP